MKKTLSKVIAVTMLASLASAVWASGAATEQNASGHKTIEQLTATCVACHGPTGISSSAAFPTIAGQHPSYIAKALADYQSGARKNPIMAGQVAGLTKADIKALAAFFAAQEGPLYTPGKN